MIFYCIYEQKPINLYKNCILISNGSQFYAHTTIIHLYEAARPWLVTVHMATDCMHPLFNDR